MASNVLILGASYGSLFGTKLLMAGHRVSMVCTKPTADLINREGTIVRFPIKGRAAPLDIAKIGQLTFEAPDFTRFPGLRLAFEALRTGRGATTVFNAANEVAVAAFIAQKIRFGAIARLVEATLEQWARAGNLAPLYSADEAIAVDHKARKLAAALLPEIAVKAS